METEKGKSRLETLEKLVAKDPHNPLGRYGLANEYLNCGMYEQAINEVNAYLKLKADQGAVYRILAQALLKLGRSDEAKEAYRKGIEVAEQHGHDEMAQEFIETLEFLE